MQNQILDIDSVFLYLKKKKQLTAVLPFLLYRENFYLE